MLMASARLDLSSVFLYAGSIAPGWVKLSDGTEKDITIIDSFEGVGACMAGRDDRGRPQAHRVRVRARARARAAACTPRTRWPRSPRRSASAFRAPPRRAAADRRRDYFAHRSGEAVVNLLRLGITTGDILTKEAFENAIALAMALGGSTNVVLHLLAIAREARGRSDAARLQPHRRQDAAHRRHEAVRQVRHERRRPPRRHPGDHEGDARRGPAARRRAHRHRQDARREPRASSTPTRSTATSSTRSTTRSTRPAASRSCTARSPPRARS